MQRLTLGDVAEYINGRAFKPDEWEDTGKPIIRIQNLTNTSKEYNRTNKGYEEKYFVTEGDLLFAWSASLGAYIWHGEDGWLNQHIFKVVPNEKVTKMYLYYYLLYVVDELYSKTHGSGMVHITLKPFKQTEIPVPSLAVQHHIVEQIENLFSKLDEAKEKAQVVVDGFETRKAAILHKAFTGRLTESWRKRNNIELDSWRTILFKDLIVAGPQNGIYKEKSAYGHGTKILRIDCFYGGYLEPWDKLKRVLLSNEEIELYKLNVNDIVINRVNSMPYLGKSALVRELPEMCVYESNMMKVELDHNKVLPEYIIKFLNSPIGLQELRKNAKQAVNQASINQQDVKKVKVTLPNIEEQGQIINILERLDKEDKAAKGKVEYVLEQIDLMKKNILMKAFQGKLGTNIPDEESAVELLKQLLVDNK